VAKFTLRKEFVKTAQSLHIVIFFNTMKTVL
jgi:hypothetical protein